ncbi:hypothetical protein CC2G_007973 [Coprinopsis cinerea AmutBmut pab1-1]|nr:hypothetical protein CC2G_007973 [Coprinopsis cinerea AmutBmut pab1-1]
MASRAILDDRNPAIQYLGAWERGGEPEEHAGTSTYTKSANSTVELSFHASGIRIIGTVDYAQDSHPNPISSYTLDETSEFRFAPQLQANKTFNVTFFEASGLQIREHQLVIRNEVQGAMLALDQVILINPDFSSLPRTTLIVSQSAPTALTTQSIPPPPVTRPSTQELHFGVKLLHQYLPSWAGRWAVLSSSRCSEFSCSSSDEGFGRRGDLLFPKKIIDTTSIRSRFQANQRAEPIHRPQASGIPLAATTQNPPITLLTTLLQKGLLQGTRRDHGLSTR